MSDSGSPSIAVDTPSPTTAQVIFFDGLSNRKRAVELRFGDRGLDLIENGLGLATWAYHDLRAVDGPPGMLRLANAATLPLARLEIRDPGLRGEILRRCGTLAPNAAAMRAQTGRIVAWSLAAVASIVLIALYGIPFLAERLTPLVPYSFEQRVGAANEQQMKLIFRGRTCTRPDGQAALEKLVAALAQAGELRVALHSEVVQSPIPNAFALAGGKVFILDGLLQRANTVDELAGVMAHELGHVAHRDHIRRLIHDGGTAFLIGLLFGDVTGSGAAILTTRTLIESSYSRDAESGADAFAITVMHKLGRSPKPLGDFLFRITGAEKSPLSILAGHPVTEERRDAMTAADRPITGPDLLSPSEWQALKRICR